MLTHFPDFREKKMKRRYLPGIILALMIFMTATNGLAKVTEEQAAKLGKELTPVGAISAANADGTIPAWQGGLPIQPQGTQPRPENGYLDDPYPNDKIRFSITAQNYKQYADKLAPGHQAMFEKYPDFVMHIYPTRRSAAFRESFYAQTLANATRCTLTEDGEGVLNQQGGFPFPLAQNGAEAILNHLNGFWGMTSLHVIPPGFIVLPNGEIISQGGSEYFAVFPNNRADAEGKYPNNRMALVDYIEPPRRKGEVILILDPKNLSAEEQKIWQYMPGQRRVRRAPGLSYDTPDPSTGNLGTYDDIYMYMGKIDRYNWKLKGRKEMFIMYNNYRIYKATRKEVMTPHFLNPDLVRWELHRVYEVEAVLKEGKRHAYAKRVLYLDEDQWNVSHTDKYDGRGNLWRYQDSVSFQAYDVQGHLPGIWFYVDLTTDTYAANSVFIETPMGMGKQNQDQDISFDIFTPEHLRRIGRR